MNRIAFAFRSFFSILFKAELAADIAQAFGYTRAAPVRVAPAPKPIAGPADGAVQILSILQRDSRLIDFLMEDISAYSDEQVGAAVRDVQQQARKSMERYLQLAPVIDGVEGTYTKAEVSDVKLIGNVPASGKAPGGMLRHKGWRAAKVELPATAPGNVLAPAEIEVE
ncbi:MAG TPA: DUF2760 domain-containing protein [Bryobacteraceae bacterium]|nr:DUF2760 domain-containing protein [Bryobacteraceae bacterium]